MDTEIRGSMRREFSLRLFTAALVVLVVVSMIMAIVLVRLNGEAVKQKLDDAESYFLTHTGEIEREWQRSASTFATHLTIAGVLRQADSNQLRAGFERAAETHFQDASFTHAQLLDVDGSLLAAFRMRSADSLLDRRHAANTEKWAYGERDQILYKKIERNVTIRERGGRLVLYAPIDRALLARLAFPDTKIELHWKGATLATGEPGRQLDKEIAGAYSGEPEKKRKLSWGDARPAPEITITSNSRSPASAAGALLLIGATVASIMLVGWWMLGRLLDVQSMRLDKLGQALAEFSADASISESVARNLVSARADANDEIARLSRNTLNMMVDIETARRAQATANESLQREKALNAQIINVSPVGIAIYNDLGACVTANAAIAKHVGLTLDQLRSKNLQSHTTWRLVGAPDLRELLAQRKSVRSEVVDYKLPNGSLASLNLIFCPLEMGGGDHVMVLTTDITDIKNSARALAESERKYRTLVSQAADAIFIADPDGRLTDINEMGLSIFGAKREEIIGRPIDDFVAERDQNSPSGYADLRRGLAVRRERLLRRLDGSTFVAEVSARLTSGGSVMGVLRDTTERRRIETEMAQLNSTLEQKVLTRTEELARANKELEAFAFAVSHDLRTPIRHIDGFSMLLASNAERSLNEDGKAYLRQIRESAQRMDELITDLLNLSRVSNGEFTPVTVSFSKMAETVRGELSQTIGLRTIEWSIEPDIRVIADPGLLRIVVTNLLSNAVKYTRLERAATIRITSSPKPSGTEVKITDNGAGFDMRFAQKLFQPFQRFHSDAEFEGTGVGLATVARIMHRHRGSISAESAPGAGSTFTLLFPKPMGESEKVGANHPAFQAFNSEQGA